MINGKQVEWIIPIFTVNIDRKCECVCVWVVNLSEKGKSFSYPSEKYGNPRLFTEYGITKDELSLLQKRAKILLDIL